MQESDLRLLQLLSKNAQLSFSDLFGLAKSQLVFGIYRLCDVCT